MAKILDQGYGACYLRQPEIAQIVVGALRFFDEVRYGLHAWVVMPNHVHVVFSQHPAWPIDSVLHSWKSYTATMANRKLERRGTFWQREAFDRVIRDEHHYVRAIQYVHRNPVVAGLCSTPEEWDYSSARLWAKGELPRP